MRHECETAEDAIWEHARAGQALPAEVRRHVHECAECARAASEANRILALMTEAGSVPASPDCREAVMARISGTRCRPVWAYAFASVILVAVIVVGLYLFQSRGPSPELARSTPPIVHETPRIPVHETAPKVTAPEPERVEPRAVALQKREPRRYRPAPHKERVPVPAPMPVVVPEEPAIPQEPEPPDEPAVEDDRPVAVVAVTWEANPSESETSYAYVQRDVETGEVLTCAVERSADSVSIVLQSTPGGKEPPEKGA